MMDLSFWETHKKKIIIAAFVFVFILLISLLFINLKKPQPPSSQNLPFPTSISQRGTGGPAGGIIGRLTPTPFKQSLKASPHPPMFLPPTKTSLLFRPFLEQ